ncbi:VWA domain-containing protein [Lentzea chajnantorensis]
MRLSVLACTTAAALLLPLTAGAARHQQQQPEPVITPAHIVVLVDESSSISAQDVEREREAAALIALGEVAPSSSIAVVGFGSDNGAQSPVDVVCPPSTVATAQDRQRLSDCVRNLRSRAAGQGDGTDHAAALQQALNYLRGDEEGPKLIFILTDGELNVSDSPRYGTDNVGNQRNLEASRQIGESLKEAAARKVQVWPLGFGKVDRAQLDRFAAESFQGRCGARSPTPSATVVTSSADVAQALLKAFQAARCVGASEIQRTPLSSGGTAEAKVTIPVIATDGSILVTKHDSRVSVSYVDPQNRTVPKSGEQDGSTFQVSGENGVVEALRIVNPLPGPWTVKITSAPGVPALDVSTVVMYQGAVRSSMTVNPPSPRPGEEVTVALSLQTRNRSITDPAALADLSFTADVTGDGFTTPIVLNDDAQNGDSRGQDGIYTGRTTIPEQAKGSVKFSGTVAGIGVSSDTRTVEAAIVSGPPVFTATGTFGNSDRKVAPGGSMKGSVTITNNSGRARKARILVADPAPGTLATIPGEQTVVELPPSGTSTFEFDLTFAADTVEGANAVTLRVVDDEQPASVIYEWQLTATVATPPPLTEIAIAVGVAAVATTALVLFIMWRRRRDVRGLVVHLFEGHRSRGDLAAPEQPSARFRFHLGEAGAGVPQLAHSAGGDDSYVLHRSGGRLTLHTPYGETRRFTVGDRVDVSPALSLQVLDEHASADFPGDQQDPYATTQPADDRSAGGNHHLL